MSTTEFDFDIDLRESEKLSNLSDKLEFFKKRLHEYERNRAGQTVINPMLPFEPYHKKVSLEIAYIKKNIDEKTAPIGNAEKIWWKGTGRQLGYLIEELERHKLIEINGEINKVIKEHFLDQKRNPFSDSIKQNRNGSAINSNNKPKGSEKIDELVSSTKSQLDE